MNYGEIGAFTFDGHFAFNIYPFRAFSNLQNDTVFIEIDQCNQVL